MQTVNDIKMIKRAKFSVRAHLFLAFLFLCGYFLTCKYVFEHPFFQTGDSRFIRLLYLMGFGQLALYGIIFFLLSFQKKIFRWLYWLFFLWTAMLLALPVYLFLEDMPHMFTYIALGCAMFVKVLFLLNVGLYLHRNSKCQIFFGSEKINEYIQQIQPIHPIQRVQPDQYTNSYEEYEEQEEDTIEEFTYPQLSIRLAICVYASLMGFPILVQIFSGFFQSLDMQSVFATKDMFIACIITAMVWTIPIFYLYFDHPYSKRIILVCIAIEFIRVLAYIPKFIDYYNSTTTIYPLRAFILFGLVDLVRYIILFYTLSPIFKEKAED